MIGMNYSTAPMRRLAWPSPLAVPELFDALLVQFREKYAELGRQLNDSDESGNERANLGKAAFIETLSGIVFFKRRQDSLIQLCGTRVILLTAPGPSCTVERRPDLKIEIGSIGDL